VVTAVESGEAADVISEQAKEKGCAITLVSRDVEIRDLGLRDARQMAQIDGREGLLGLIGPHQVDNAACAIVALRQHGVADEAIHRGLATALWPGRFEILSEKPLIVLDGAHNAAGMRKLIETWQAFLHSRFGWNAAECAGRAHLVFASVSDKDITEMARLLRPWARQVSIARLANERTAEPATIAPAFAPLPCRLVDSVADVWQSIEHGDDDVPVLVTGSLFLVGEMLAQRYGTTEEYQLNERLETFTTLP
jgi:dihydrofolate synthase/folylpolyglutamate synthase